MTETLDRRNSVTKADFISSAEAGGVYVWQVFDPGAVASPVPSLPVAGSRARDAMLMGTLDLEDMWAIAVNKAATKFALRGYEISDSDDSTRRTEKGKTLVMNFDGLSEYRRGCVKVALDFLNTDNGWFVEIERESKSPASRPRALWHLDSFRCYRTGNDEYPVLYMDYLGSLHKLRADQVLFGADMSSPRATMWNRGRCAAARVFSTIVKLSAMETYFREKITGSRALALYFISGLAPKQLSDAIETSNAENARRGHVVYKGAVMVPIQSDQAITVSSIDLASIPDGFEAEQQQKDGYRKYALTLGMNPDELVERAAGLNSGTSAQVMADESEQGGALPYLTKDWEDKLNNMVFPKATIFVLSQNDTRDKKAKADLDKSKADTIITLMGNGQAPGVISQQMALQMAVDEGLVPREFLPADVTPEGVLTDSGDQSKPAGLPALAPYAGQLPAPQAPQPMAAKASEPDEWEQAVTWAEDSQEEATKE